MIYLIDYENVQDLKDVKELTSEDSVIVFHSGQTKRIQSDFIFDAIERVKFKAKRIVSGKKNALDFQLVSYLGYLIGKGETDIKIVSKDTGYDCLVDFWKGKANIMRGETFITVKDEPKEEKPLEKESSTAKKVAKKNTQKKTAKKAKAENKEPTLEEKVRDCLKDYPIEEKYLLSIVKIVEENDTKVGINSALQKHFKVDISDLYRALKPALKGKK